MSTDGHDQTHANGHGEHVDTVTESHAHPLEASALTIANTDTPEHVPPHPEDHASDNGAANNASISPVVKLIPQAEPPHAESKPELYHDDTANTMESGRHSEDEGTDEDEDDEDEDEGDDEEEEDENEEEDEDEDEDEEPALKYERFGGGAYQDLLKKDSASTLAVSNKFLVTYAILNQWTQLTLPYRRSVHIMDSHISWTSRANAPRHSNPIRHRSWTCVSILQRILLPQPQWTVNI